jgi:hypothetical protein
MALKRYAIWDKTSHVYTPAGEDLTPEEWISRYSWINAPSATPVVAKGLINGGFCGELSQMKDFAEDAGAVFDESLEGEALLEAIEAWEDKVNTPSGKPNAEERTAAALEQIAAGTTSENTEALNALLGEEEANA